MGFGDAALVVAAEAVHYVSWGDLLHENVVAIHDSIQYTATLFERGKEQEVWSATATLEGSVLSRSFSYLIGRVAKDLTIKLRQDGLLPVR